MAGERETGVVKNFDPGRGYGFIERASGEDVFVHRTALARAGIDVLNSGDRVSFTVRKTDRGYQAENLKLEQARSGTSIARTAATGRPSTKTDFRFGPDYLPDGYFKDPDKKQYLLPEVLDTWAMDVAKLLGNKQMKSHQLRRFFNKARGIEAKLDREHDFEAIKADIYGFKRDVAYQVGRKVVPEEFQQFIDRNVELAVVDEASFRRGFLEHFQSVLAYFVYFFREND